MRIGPDLVCLLLSAACLTLSVVLIFVGVRCPVCEASRNADVHVGMNQAGGDAGAAHADHRQHP